MSQCTSAGAAFAARTNPSATIPSTASSSAAPTRSGRTGRDPGNTTTAPAADTIGAAGPAAATEGAADTAGRPTTTSSAPASGPLAPGRRPGGRATPRGA